MIIKKLPPLASIMPIIVMFFLFLNINNVSAQFTPNGSNLYHLNGDVGIGTNSPEARLEIKETDSVNIRLRTSNDSYIPTPCKGWEDYIWDIQNKGDLRFNSFYSYCGSTSPYKTIMALTPEGRVSIGTDVPHQSSILHINSTDKGLLIPRMLTSEKEAINSPANGLLVYDTDLQAFNFYDNGNWKEITVNSTLNNYLTQNDFNNSLAGNITQGDTANWNTAYNFSQNFTETDPVFTAHLSAGITEQDTTNWNTAYNWTQNFTETDPIFTAWDKNYNDLINKPILFDGQWSSLNGTPPGVSTFINDVGYITNANLNYLWLENGDNIYRTDGNIGIGTNIPKKNLEIYSVYNVGAGSFFETSTIRLTNKKVKYNEPKTHAPGPPEDIVPEYLYKWDIENANDTLNFKFIRYDPAQIGLGQNINPETKISFSGDGTLTAAKFVGDGSGLTNIGLNGPLILDNDMEPWTNAGWRARLQSPLGTVWASTNKSNLGNYYLGLGMTNSGWYFMKRYENGDYNYVTVIREDGRIRCTEVVIETNEWKDNVFNKTYNLKSIEETEQYISQHGHLPDIPSEKEIIKNGLETSEMIKLQMQKIEELTLYIIEQNKRIKALEKKAGSKQ